MKIHSCNRNRQEENKNMLKVRIEPHDFKITHYIRLSQRLECSPIARETWVRSQVESYQRLKKWYLMPHCLTLSIIRYGSRVKWSNPGKGVAPSPTHWCSKLSIRGPSGHPRLWSPTLLTLYTLANETNGLSTFLSSSHILAAQISLEKKCSPFETSELTILFTGSNYTDRLQVRNDGIIYIRNSTSI